MSLGDQFPYENTSPAELQIIRDRLCATDQRYCPTFGQTWDDQVELWIQTHQNMMVFIAILFVVALITGCALIYFAFKDWRESR